MKDVQCILFSTGCKAFDSQVSKQETVVYVDITNLALNELVQ